MAQQYEELFYEVMWRAHARGGPYPLPWWMQQYFRAWTEHFDSGMFDSIQAAFAGNAYYRYWSMVGVKDHHQESLVGQAGELEPVYDRYSLGFFLFDPATRALDLPQAYGRPGPGPQLRQQLDSGYLPVIVTTYEPPGGIRVTAIVQSTTTVVEQRALTLLRLDARLTGLPVGPRWLCLFLQAAGPSGLNRRYRGRPDIADHRLASLLYSVNDRQVRTNSSLGPAFDTAPATFGLYGNAAGGGDPELYLSDNPFADLARRGQLNGQVQVNDPVAGLCTAVFAWPFDLAEGEEFTLVTRVPMDDFRGDLAQLRADPYGTLAAANRTFWTGKLDGNGPLQAGLPPTVRHLWDLFRSCRANLLILTDRGEIHPGPTIYDSFWIRDSSVESIAAALVGDQNVAVRQVGDLYRAVLHTEDRPIGPVSSRGFFGGAHEVDHHEWDSNGQVLWAIGRLDRILGPSAQFGAGMFAPYVVEGARWLRDNRDQYGLLHSGWSAEHLGSASKPHYWDDLWAIAGLYEAARLGERITAPQTGQLWATYDDVRVATQRSIEWVLAEQQRRGQWQTFVPTGPADVDGLNSEMIGACAYFHPCRVYQGAKLGAHVDWAFRMTLETIWHHLVATTRFPAARGFQHDAAWNTYGPYLTLQLAHAFLLIGDVARMDQCLAWTVGAGYPRLSRAPGAGEQWQVALAAWNEQHSYPVAEDFGYMPGRPWYMGDVPHGWAAAELMLLLRDILVFESDEDGHPHLYLSAGVLPHWLGDTETIRVTDAPTVFGSPVSYTMRHEQANRRLLLDITDAPPGVSYVVPCRYGQVTQVTADGANLSVAGPDVGLPGGTSNASITYQ